MYLVRMHYMDKLFQDMTSLFEVILKVQLAFEV